MPADFAIGPKRKRPKPRKRRKQPTGSDVALFQRAKSKHRPKVKKAPQARGPQGLPIQRESKQKRTAPPKEQFRSKAKGSDKALLQRAGSKARYDGESKPSSQARDGFHKAELRKASLAAPLTDDLDEAIKDIKSTASWALDKASRPAHAVAAAAKHDVKQVKKYGVKGLVGHGSLKAAKRGLEGKDKTLFSDVLEEAGVDNKIVRGVVGFGLDVALDPVNLATLGAAAPARIAARATEQAVLREGAKDVAAGKLTQAALDAKAHRAAKEVYDKAPEHAKRKGVRVKVPGVRKTGDKKVKVGVRSARNKAGKEVWTRPVGTRLNLALTGTAQPLRQRAAKATALASRVGQEMIHDFRPADIDEVTHGFIRDTARRARVARDHADRYAEERAKLIDRAIRKAKLTDKDEFEIIKAIEAKDLDRLDDVIAGEKRAKAAREIAEMYQRHMEEVGAKEVERGILTVADVRGRRPQLVDFIELPNGRPNRNAAADYRRALAEYGTRPPGYFYRPPRHESYRQAVTTLGKKPREAVEGSKARTRRMALEAMTPEDLDIYDLRLARSLGERLRKHGRDMGTADFLERAAALGRPIDEDRLADLIANGVTDAERVVIQTPKGFKPIVDKRNQIDAAAARQALDADMPVLEIPEREWAVLREMRERGRRSGEVDANIFSEGFDRGQAKLKTLQTVINPGYHGTNLIGDTFNAKVGEATLRDIVRGVRLKRLERELDLAERRMKEELPPKIVKRGQRKERYGDDELTDMELVKEAIREGAVKTGFGGNELRNLSRGDDIHINSLRNHPVEWTLDGIQSISERREDMLRLASYYSARRRGLSPSEAAQHVNRHHFDYSDITPTERAVMRRFFPFYTFMSRNLRLQASAIVTRPSMYSHYEMLQDEAAAMSGLEQDWDEALNRQGQQSMPIALPRELTDLMPFDTDHQLSVNPKVPLMDLNFLSGDFGELKDQIVSRMSVLLKVPIEQALAYNTFAGAEYGKDRVPAPSWTRNKTLREAFNRVMADVTGKEPAIKKIVDRKTGREVWGWSWRIDQLLRQTPQTNMMANLTTPSRQKHPEDSALAVTAWLLGPRGAVVDPNQIALDQAWELRDKLQTEADELKEGERPRKPGEEWGGKIGKLNKEIVKAERDIYKLSKKGGAKYPPGRPPKKRRVKKGIFGGSGSSVFGGSAEDIF